MTDYKNNLLSSPSNKPLYQISPQGKAKKLNLQEANLRTYNNYTIFFVTNLTSLLLVLIAPVYGCVIGTRNMSHDCHMTT